MEVEVTVVQSDLDIHCPLYHKVVHTASKLGTGGAQITIYVVSIGKLGHAGHLTASLKIKISVKCKEIRLNIKSVTFSKNTISVSHPNQTLSVDLTVTPVVTVGDVVPRLSGASSGHVLRYPKILLQQGHLCCCQQTRGHSILSFPFCQREIYKTKQKE